MHLSTGMRGGGNSALWHMDTAAWFILVCTCCTFFHSQCFGGSVFSIVNDKNCAEGCQEKIWPMFAYCSLCNTMLIVRVWSVHMKLFFRQHTYWWISLWQLCKLLRTGDLCLPSLSACCHCAPWNQTEVILISILVWGHCLYGVHLWSCLLYGFWFNTNTPDSCLHMIYMMYMMYDTPIHQQYAKIRRESNHFFFYGCFCSCALRFRDDLSVIIFVTSILTVSRHRSVRINVGRFSRKEQRLSCIFYAPFSQPVFECYTTYSSANCV